MSLVLLENAAFSRRTPQAVIKRNIGLDRLVPLDNHAASYGYGATMDLIWRGALSLKQFGAAFRENEIDGTLVLSMTSKNQGFTNATRMKRWPFASRAPHRQGAELSATKQTNT